MSALSVVQTLSILCIPSEHSAFQQPLVSLPSSMLLSLTLLVCSTAYARTGRAARTFSVSERPSVSLSHVRAENSWPSAGPKRSIWKENCFLQIKSIYERCLQECPMHFGEPRVGRSIAHSLLNRRGVI